MTRTRLLVLVVGAGLLLGVTPALAAPAPAEAAEREALGLLQVAARAGRDLTYTGTQYVASWRDRQDGAALAEVRHDPARGSRVEADEPLAATAVLDPRQLVLLAAAYDLKVAGPGTCTGRPAQVVTASRADGSPAGRFWLDRRSGLLLRREVYDASGARLRSSAFVDLVVSPGAGRPTVAPAFLTATTMPQASTLGALRRDGWRVPRALPGGFRLFETVLSTPRPGRQLLHLAYSDGLSTVSLFTQRGRLGTAPMQGFRPESVGSRPVWVRPGTPERVVWSGGGRVWTLVSDAPGQDVRRAVAALPRDAAPREGVRARLGRGLSRLGALLNPFR